MVGSGERWERVEKMGWGERVCVGGKLVREWGKEGRMDRNLR